MKPRQLAIKLHDGGKIIMQTTAPEEVIAFAGLGELLDVKIDFSTRGADAEIIPADHLTAGCFLLRDNACLKAAYAADWSKVWVAGLKPNHRRPHYYHCCIWQTALMYAAMNALLRGENAVLVHGAALETERGAVLIFGESGMGKSTAATRWKLAGGKCVSDDMLLLDFSSAGIFVRRMPTWSACREGKNPGNYPATEELPLRGVLALGRSTSGKDEIVPVSAAQYFAQCYRSLFYWQVFFAKALPADKQRVLADRIKFLATTVVEKFAPRALLTALEGDLVQLFRGYQWN